MQPRGRSRCNSRPGVEKVVSRDYLDQYRDEEIQEVLMEVDQGDVEEDGLGSVSGLDCSNCMVNVVVSNESQQPRDCRTRFYGRST